MLPRSASVSGTPSLSVLPCLHRPFETLHAGLGEPSYFLQMPGSLKPTCH